MSAWSDEHDDFMALVGIDTDSIAERWDGFGVYRAFITLDDEDEGGEEE